MPINSSSLSSEIYQAMAPDLLKAETVITRSREAALASSTPSRLFHYTNSMGLKGILESSRIWATHFRFLNDASEIDYGMFVVGACIDDLKGHYKDPIALEFLDRALRTINPFDGMFDCYIACFCAKDDLLNQWRNYAGIQGGYALGFDAEEIGAGRSSPLAPEHDFVLHKVIYDPAEQHKLVREVLEVTIEVLRIHTQNMSAQDANIHIARCCRFARQVVADYLVAFKHPAFEVEHEWRICHMVDPGSADHIKFRDGQFGLTPYVTLDPSPAFGPNKDKLPLAQITHAPTKEADNVRFALKLLLRMTRYHGVEVAGSVLPIRAG